MGKVRHLSRAQKLRWQEKTYEREMILSRRQGEGAFPVVLVLDHLKASFNVGKILRSAHAFGAREVHLVGIGAIDPAPAKGTLKQTRTREFATVAESIAELEREGYAIFCLDAKAEAKLGVSELPPRSAFILGHEEFGLSFDRAAFPSVRPIAIPQFGRVESLNVSVAASLALFEYARQRGFSAPKDWQPAPSRDLGPPVRAPGEELPLP